MKLDEDIKPVTFLKTRSAEVLRSVKRSRRPMVITQHGEAQAVVLDVKTYESMKDAVSMLRILSQSEAEVQRGATVSVDAAFKRMRKAVKRR